MPWRGESRPIQGDAAVQSAHRYRVIDKLESGGMAEVVRAESTGLEGFRKQVAIKRVLPHLGTNSKFISLFLDKARLSAQLSHSKLCPCVRHRRARRRLFIVVTETACWVTFSARATAVSRSLPRTAQQAVVP